MARPRKTKHELDKVIGLRIDSATLATWSSQARAAGLSISEWARLRIAGGQALRYLRRRDPPPADPRLLAAIARAGNNLNQIARAGNRRQLPEQIDLLEQLIRIERALNDLVPPR